MEEQYTFLPEEISRDAKEVSRSLVARYGRTLSASGAGYGFVMDSLWIREARRVVTGA